MRYLFACVLLLFLASALHADIVIDFSNSGDLAAFAGDGVGDIAGSFNVDGVDGIITTRAITDDGVLGFDGSVGLGIDALTGDPGDIDPGELWAFDWDIDTSLTGVVGLNLNVGDIIVVQSDDWKHLVLTPGSSNVLFDSASGEFTLNGSEPSDDWNLTDLTGGADLLKVHSGTDIVIRNGGTDENFELRSLAFRGVSAVPEPGSMGLFTLMAGGYLFRRRLRKSRKVTG